MSSYVELCREYLRAESDFRKLDIHVAAVRSGELRIVSVMGATFQGRGQPGLLLALRAWFLSFNRCVR